MSTIKVDLDKCAACSTCYSLFPELFEEGEGGKSKVISSDYVAHGYTKEEIIAACPEGAISIED